jgi:hypothetical protein
VRVLSHPSNLELLTAVSMNDQSFILSYFGPLTGTCCFFSSGGVRICLFSNKFDSEEVKSLELMIGDRNDRNTYDSRNVSGKKMRPRPPLNPADLGLDTTII